MVSIQLADGPPFLFSWLLYLFVLSQNLLLLKYLNFLPKDYGLNPCVPPDNLIL